MTGPEHYAEAERLLQAARDELIRAAEADRENRASRVRGGTPYVDSVLLGLPVTLATAQAHATLALAAATAASIPPGSAAGGDNRMVSHEWAQAGAW